MDVGPIRLGLAPRALLPAVAGIQHRLQHAVAQRRRSGQRRPAAATRSKVSATVLRAMLRDRAIARSVAPHFVLEAQESRVTRRIDTLSAGIGPSALVVATSRAPSTAQRSSARHPSRGGRLQIGMAEIKSESVADFARNTQ